MRLFVGIALAPETADALLRVRERFEAVAGSELRWSAPEGWHVTLQFLGQVSEEQALCVVEKLAAVRAARVPVRIAGLGFFERAGVFWAGVTLTPELPALQQFVTAAMQNCGFEPEEKGVQPAHHAGTREGAPRGERAGASEESGGPRRSGFRGRVYCR